jgi:hypothetical protein
MTAGTGPYAIGALSGACLRLAPVSQARPDYHPTGLALQHQCGVTAPGVIRDGRPAPTIEPAIIPGLPVSWARRACTCFRPLCSERRPMDCPARWGIGIFQRARQMLPASAEGISVGVIARHWDRLVRRGERVKAPAGNPAKSHARARAFSSGRGDLRRSSRDHIISLYPLSPGRSGVRAFPMKSH